MIGNDDKKGEEEEEAAAHYGRAAEEDEDDDGEEGGVNDEEGAKSWAWGRLHHDPEKGSPRYASTFHHGPQNFS